MDSIIPERQLTLAEKLSVIGTMDGLMELGHHGITVSDDSNADGLVISSEDSENPSVIHASLTDDPHPAFGYSVDGISLSASVASESFGEGNILVEPSIKKTGSLEIWVDITRKCHLRTQKSVVLVDNGENAELISQIAETLEHPDYLKIANDLSIQELVAMSQKCSVGITSTPGGLLLLLSSMTPFLHVYSTMPEKQLIDDMALSSHGFGYRMLDKGQSPAVITAKLRDMIADEIFLRKEIEKFRVFMRHEFLGVLRELLA